MSIKRGMKTIYEALCLAMITFNKWHHRLLVTSDPMDEMSYHFMGYPVYPNKMAIKRLFGIPLSYKTAVAVFVTHTDGEPRIYVNQPLMRCPESVRRALLSHEVGLIKRATSRGYDRRRHCALADDVFADDFSAHIYGKKCVISAIRLVSRGWLLTPSQLIGAQYRIQKLEEN